VGQAILAGLIVLTAALYAAWALMPAALRFRLALRFAAVARRGGQPSWLARTAVAIERNARRGLGGCSECSAVQPEPVPPKRLDKD
jgi:hypothetical protein